MVRAWWTLSSEIVMSDTEFETKSKLLMSGRVCEL